jgi:HK97 family phage major capsid protein
MSPTADQLLAQLDETLERRGRRSSYAEYRSGRSLAHGIAASPEAAWWKHALAAGSEDPQAALDLEEQRALSKSSGPVGAYLVPADLEAEILSAVHARGSIGRLAREIVTANGRNLNLPVASSHGLGSWISEAGAFSASSDEVLANVALGAFKSGSTLVVSEELARDMLSEFDAFLADELAQRIAQLEGAAFANGDGTNKPLGAVANLTQLQAATGSTLKFTLADLTNAVHTVAPGYREPEQNPAWVMSDGCLKSLRTVVDSAGAAILIDPSSPGDRIRLLGFDVYVDENLAAPAANAKSCKVLHLRRLAHGLPHQTRPGLLADAPRRTPKCVGPARLQEHVSRRRPDRRRRGRRDSSAQCDMKHPREHPLAEYRRPPTRLEQPELAERQRHSWRGERGLLVRFGSKRT